MLRYLVANVHVKRNGFALLLTVQVRPNSWPSFLSRHLVESANRVTGNDDDNTDRKLVDCLPRLPLFVCTASQICLSKEKPVTPKNRRLAIKKIFLCFFFCYNWIWTFQFETCAERSNEDSRAIDGELVETHLGTHIRSWRIRLFCFRFLFVHLASGDTYPPVTKFSFYQRNARFLIEND